MDPTTYPTNPLTGGPATLQPAPPWGERIAYTRWAFYSGLAGGVLILLCAFVIALFIVALATFGGVLPSWPWFTTTTRATWPSLPLFIGIWGLLTGGGVLLASLAARERPDHAAVPGVIMMIGGVLSFFALGGFFVGGVLSIVAGVLAIAGSRSLWHERHPRYREYERARPGP